jgi:hypothetical protein
MARRALSWRLLTSATDHFEGDGKREAVYQEHGEAHLELAETRCRAFSVAPCFRFVSRCMKSPAGYDIAVGGAKKEMPLLQQKRRPEVTAGDGCAEVGVKKKRQADLAHLSPCVQALLRVYSSGGSTFRSRFRWLLQLSESVLVSCFSRPVLASVSGVDIVDNGTNVDNVTNDQLSVIWLNGGNHVDNDAVSTFGDHDSAGFTATAVQRTHDGNATVDVVESVASSAECPVECGATAEEITVDLGGSGEPRELLGGLSLTGYERIVFSVCPALPAVDTEF